MKIGQVTAVKVDDVTLWIKLTWLGYKQMRRESDAFGSAEEDPEAWLKFTEDKLKEQTVRVEGLVDADDVPVTELTQAVIDQLPPRFVAEAFAGIMSAGAEVEEAGEAEGG